ncbi:MAG: rod shape-determining protein RodA [Desulfatibacillum sp.]|nr:rod shape-determining protein RodA [Desulfatibacillum sp.]
MFDRRLLQYFDWGLLLLILVIMGVGLLTLYSAVASDTNPAEMRLYYKQLTWFGTGLVAMIICFFPHYHLLDRWVWVVYAVGLFLLILVLLVGKKISGSVRWLSLGPFTYQPSEFAKLAIMVVLAHHYSQNIRTGGLGLIDLLKPFIYMSIPFVLVFMEPDLGTGLLVLLIGGAMTLFVGIGRRTMAWLAALCAAIGPLAWFYVLKPYQKERIFTFLDPDRDPLGAGYHIIQSKIAIGSGMLTGKGYLEGSQKSLAFLPEQHTDFIFSVFAEEWGLAGSLVLLFLFLMLIIWGLNIAYRSRDPFGALLAIGVTSMIFWQVFINVGMVMGLMPVVGVPLPLVSYGGSSVLTIMMGLGLLLNISMRRFLFE